MRQNLWQAKGGADAAFKSSSFLPKASLTAFGVVAGAEPSAGSASKLACCGTRPELHMTFERLKNWDQTRASFKLALAEHEWVIYE